MPKIPRRKQKGILNPSASRTVSARGLGTGESIQSFGRSIAKAGKAASNFQKRGEQVDKGLLKESIRQKIRKEASEADHFARTNPNKSQDGSTLVKDFNKKLEPLRREIESGLDGTAKQIAKNIFRDVAITKRNDLRETARQEKDKFQKEKIDEYKREATARVASSPDTKTTFEEMESLENYVDSLNLVKKDGKSVKADLKKELALSSINTMVENAEFDQAKQALNEDYAKFLTGTETKKASNYIDNQQINYENRQQKLEAQKRRERKRRLKRTQAKNELKFFKKARNANTAEELSKLEEQVFQAARNRQVSRDFPQTFIADSNQVSDDISAMSRFKLRDDMAKGDTGDFIARINKKVNKGELNPGDAEYILEEYINVIEQDQESKDLLPGGMPPTRYFRKSLEPFLETGVSEGGGIFFKKESIETRNYARRRFVEHMRNEKDPIVATKKALMDTFGKTEVMEEAPINAFAPSEQNQSNEEIRQRLRKKAMKIRRMAKRLGGIKNVDPAILRTFNQQIKQLEKREVAERIKRMADPNTPPMSRMKRADDDEVDDLFNTENYLDPDAYGKENNF